MNFSLPTSVDWRTVPKTVNAIKSQARCGSCWSFSAIGSLESAYAIANGVLLDMSEQNLVDCVYNSDGCQGGWMTDAWNYIQQNNNLISTESSYPYG